MNEERKREIATVRERKEFELIVNNYIVLTSMKTDLEKIKRQALNFKPFRYCSATVAENDEYIVLKSYATIVAYIRKSDMYCFDVLRKVYGYTSISNKHIAKFIKDYSPQKVYSYRYK